VSSTTAWSVIGIVFTAIYILPFLILAFLIRHVRDEYNEYKLVRIAIPICLTSPAAQLLVWILKQIFVVSVEVKVFGRVLETAAILIPVGYFFWGPLAIPMWNHRFHREEYLENFLKGVHASSDKFVQEGVEQSHKTMQKALAKMENDSYGNGPPQYTFSSPLRTPERSESTELVETPPST